MTHTDTIRWSFNTEDDGTEIVLLSRAPGGKWIATLVEDDSEAPIVWGIGDTKMAAIADMEVAR